MLKIRKEQMDALGAYMLRQFEKRMVKHLRKDFPKELQEHNIKKQDLEQMVRRGIADAKNYGVEYEDDLKLYVECMLLLSPNFDQDERFPWAKQILTREDVDGDIKMSEINEYLIFGMQEPK
jgi:hypothetical protein